MRDEINKRAQRIHHRERLKQKRRKYTVNYNWADLKESTNERWLGIIVDTPKPCNCWMCSKPKKHTASIAEIRETQPKLFEDNE